MAERLGLPSHDALGWAPPSGKRGQAVSLRKCSLVSSRLTASEGLHTTPALSDHSGGSPEEGRITQCFVLNWIGGDVDVIAASQTSASGYRSIALNQASREVLKASSSCACPRTTTAASDTRLLPDRTPAQAV